MNTETKSNKPNLREEFRLWYHAAPRVWLIIGAVVLAAIVFRNALIAFASTVLFFALLLGVLFVLPAVIGAVAGSTVRDTRRWIRNRGMRKKLRG